MSVSFEPGRIVNEKLLETLLDLSNKVVKFKERKSLASLVTSMNAFAQKYISEYNGVIEFFGKKETSEDGKVLYRVENDALKESDPKKFEEYKEAMKSLSSAKFTIDGPVKATIKQEDSELFTFEKLCLLEGLIDLHVEGEE